MFKLILIRGLPGSGKSTMAKEMLDFYGQGINEGWYEADMYFMMKDGEYHFNPSLIKNAHSWCLAQTDRYCTNKAEGVCIVSNTFVKKWELQPYIDISKKYGIELEIIEASGTYENVHHVPKDVIERMRHSWEIV